MLTETNNLEKLTPIHTNFGSNSSDLLVVEYDVPPTKIKQTLFYKFGQLSIPKWALIPAGILTFGLLTALCAIIVSSILSQPITPITYSQACSKTSRCKSELGLICGSQSTCVCSNKQYWYEGICVNQPTYREQCNQTTECRTDLGLMCAEIEGQCNCPNITIVQTCDCSSTSYWTGSTCTDRLSHGGACSVADTSYQCLSSLYCNGSMCICAPNSQYWNLTANECYSVDKYLDLCNQSTWYSCNANASLFCLPAGNGSQCPLNVTAGSTSCDCAMGTYWNGGSCVPKKLINTPCFWDCECDSVAGLQCLNMCCVCPKKYFWLSSSCQTQQNYTGPCSSTSTCDATQGLTCYLNGSGPPCNCPQNSSVNTCDCLTTQYYDSNLTSCQTLLLYNDICVGNYMCDSSLGLFCQLTNSSATNCSCPEPIRSNMCDCNMTSYWDGVACVSRLAPNSSCSYPYQCQTNYTCIVNETDLGVFSDVCRCPLGSYFINGTGCVSSKNYTQSCEGSYECYEKAPLSCRYNDTGLTCLDAIVTTLPACDCPDNYYFDTSLELCFPLVNRTYNCTQTCQCIQPYQCLSNKCQCANFYSSLNQSCVQYLTYGDACSSSAECNATPNALLSCGASNTCGCGATGFWDGSKCQYTINFRAACASNTNCFTGLVCLNIPCLNPNQRCSCPANTYYSSTRHNCTPCTGSDSGYNRYVINYPNSDLCVAVRVPSHANTISFSTADSQCNGLTQMVSANTTRLLSVHSQTELDCIAAVLKSEPGANSAKCNNRLYYLGFVSATSTFYDGTLYSPASFPGPTISSSDCLTYCYNNGGSGTGSLSANSCNDFFSSNRYGAICDYRVY